MKCRFIYLLSLVFILFSCNNSSEKTENNEANMTLTGTITNPKSEVVLLLTSDMAMMNGITKIDTAILDSNGNFSLLTKIPYEGFYTFRHGREIATVFLNIGDDLILTLDTEEFDETLKFSGKGADVNNYLSKKLLLTEEIEVHYSKLYAYELQRFNDKIDSVRQVLESEFDKFKKYYPQTSKNFIKLEECRLLYAWAIQKVYYPWYHASYAKIDQWSPEDDYYDFVKDLNLNDDLILEVQDAYGFVQNVIYYYSDKVYKADSITYSNMKNGVEYSKMKAVETYFTNEKIRQKLAFNIMKQYVSNNGIANVENMYTEFKTLCSDTSSIIEIDNLLKKWEHLQAGKPAPAFTCFDIDDNEVYLSDFKGKNVYIDFWATWCRPCIAEAPYFHDLQVKYESENLVFLSISIDKDVEKWKKFAIKNKLDGIQLNAGANKKELSKSYIISSIPRFVLIDKEGNLVNIKAPRPSSDKIEAELKKLM